MKSLFFLALMALWSCAKFTPLEVPDDSSENSESGINDPENPIADSPVEDDNPPGPGPAPGPDTSPTPPPDEPVLGTEYFVELGKNGNGSMGNPFGRISDGLAVAMPGDVVTVKPGTYSESLSTVRNGTQDSYITVRAEGDLGSVIVTTSIGRVFDINHANFRINRLVIDGQYGGKIIDGKYKDLDTVRLRGNADFFNLRASEIRKSALDCIDMSDQEGVLIENSLIHHCLNSTGGRFDAHGITGGAVRDLVIRNTEIHTFSGDAVQFDPGRSAIGWDNILIEGCYFWLAPLTQAENGFPAGTVTGENALDTKVGSGFRPKITITDTVASGFGGGLITNMAAFNIKENVDATLDRVTIRDSEIALRLRGPAFVKVKNTLIYDVEKAIRYENDIRNLKLWNITIGSGVNRAFQAGSSDSVGLDVKNFLVLGGSLPTEAQGPSNLAVNSTAFVDSDNHNYNLSTNSPAIDKGTPLAEVTTDLEGKTRPRGITHDVGAFEF